MSDEYEIREVRSTLRAFNDFIEGTIWADMKDTLESWREGIRDALGSLESDEKTDCVNKGRLDMLNMMLVLPEVIRDSLIAEQLDESQESE